MLNELPYIIFKSFKSIDTSDYCDLVYKMYAFYSYYILRKQNEDYLSIMYLIMRFCISTMKFCIDSFCYKQLKFY